MEWLDEIRGRGAIKDLGSAGYAPLVREIVGGTPGEGGVRVDSTGGLPLVDSRGLPQGWGLEMMQSAGSGCCISLCVSLYLF